MTNEEIRAMIQLIHKFQRDDSNREELVHAGRVIGWTEGKYEALRVACSDDERDSVVGFARILARS
jgi:hypothetical protein